MPRESSAAYQLEEARRDAAPFYSLLFKFGGTFAVSSQSILSSGAVSATYHSSSYIPTANRLQLAIIGSSKASTPDLPAVLGNNVNWTLMGTIAFNSGQRRLSVLAGVSTFPSGDQPTITFAGAQTGCDVSIVQFENVFADDISIIRQIGVNFGVGLTTFSTLQLALGDLLSGSAVLAAFYTAANNAITPGTGYQEIYDAGRSSPDARIETEYSVPFTSLQGCNASWPAADAGAIIIEIAVNALKVGDTRLADREVTINGDVHHGVVASFGNYQELVPASDGKFQIGVMPIEIINTPAFGTPPARFSTLLKNAGTSGVEVESYQNFTKANGGILQQPFHSFVARIRESSQYRIKIDLESISEKYRLTWSVALPKSRITVLPASNRARISTMKSPASDA